MCAFIQLLLFHLFDEFAYLDICFFDGFDIFRRHPFMIVPRMVCMYGIQKYEGGLFPVFYDELESLVVIGKVSIVLQIADFIKIGFVMGIK